MEQEVEEEEEDEKETALPEQATSKWKPNV